MKQQQKWLALKAKANEMEMGHVIEAIDKIDRDTPWQCVAPEWWIEMMTHRRNLMILMKDAI